MKRKRNAAINAKKNFAQFIRYLFQAVGYAATA